MRVRNHGTIPCLRHEAFQSHAEDPALSAPSYASGTTLTSPE